MTFITQRNNLLGILFAATAVVAAAGAPAADTPEATAPTSAPAVSAPADSPSAAAADDGCPPDVNLMYEWLKATPAIFNEIDKSVTGIGEPKCADGWSTALTVVKNADPLVVLFKYEPNTGKWIPVGLGSDGVCDGAVKVPEAVQAKLHPGC